MTEPAPDLIVAATRMFDGRRDSTVEEGIAVGIRGGTIVAVAPLEELKTRWKIHRVDEYADATLLPGLIDSHVHLTMAGDGSDPSAAATASFAQRIAWAERNGDRHVRGGVTTVRDLGSHADAVAWAHQRVPPAPRVIAYGPPITRSGSHGALWGGGCRDARELRDRLREHSRCGADGFKVMANADTMMVATRALSFSEAEMQLIAEYAHAEGKLATAHATLAASARQVADARFDGIEHLGYLDRNGDRRLEPGLAERLARSGVTVTTTLALNYRYLDGAQSYLDPTTRARERERLEYVVRNAATLYRHGVRLIVGTDAGWGNTPFGDLALELERLMEADIPTRDVLAAATDEPARYLGVNAGRIEMGKSADLLVLHGDPFADAGALRRVAGVYRAGVRVGDGDLPGPTSLRPKAAGSH